MRRLSLRGKVKGDLSWQRRSWKVKPLSLGWARQLHVWMSIIRDCDLWYPRTIELAGSNPSWEPWSCPVGLSDISDHNQGRLWTKQQLDVPTMMLSLSCRPLFLQTFCRLIPEELVEGSRNSCHALRNWQAYHRHLSSVLLVHPGRTKTLQSSRGSSDWSWKMWTTEEKFSPSPEILGPASLSWLQITSFCTGG